MRLIFWVFFPLRVRGSVQTKIMRVKCSWCIKVSWVWIIANIGKVRRQLRRHLIFQVFVRWVHNIMYPDKCTLHGIQINGTCWPFQNVKYKSKKMDSLLIWVWSTAMHGSPNCISGILLVALLHNSRDAIRGQVRFGAPVTFIIFTYLQFSKIPYLL